MNETQARHAITDLIAQFPRTESAEWIAYRMFSRDYSRVLSRVQFLIFLKLGIEVDSDVLLSILKEQNVRLSNNPMCPEDPIVGLHKCVFDMEQKCTRWFKPKTKAMSL